VHSLTLIAASALLALGDVQRQCHERQRAVGIARIGIIVEAQIDRQHAAADFARQ
jgi:hypothetical protein